MANRLWGQKNYGFQPDFLKIGQDNYGAGLEEVDFIAHEEARNKINAWVEKQTKDKIKDLLKPGVLTLDTRLVLTNAIYFKAAWTKAFRPEQTKHEPFYLADGKIAKTPMMHDRKKAGFADLDSFTMVELTYDGNQQSMVILLPKKKDGLGHWKNSSPPRTWPAGWPS